MLSCTLNLILMLNILPTSAERPSARRLGINILSIKIAFALSAQLAETQQNALRHTDWKR